MKQQAPDQVHIELQHQHRAIAEMQDTVARAVQEVCYFHIRNVLITAKHHVAYLRLRCAVVACGVTEHTCPLRASYKCGVQGRLRETIANNIVRMPAFLPIKIQRNPW